MKFFTSLSLILLLGFSASAAPLNFDDDDDQLTVNVLYSTLMNATNDDEPLDVEFNVTVANSNVIIFSMKTAESLDFVLTLTDLEGNMVAERNFTAVVGDNYRTLNISNVLEGNYMISLRSGNKKALKLIGIVEGE